MKVLHSYLKKNLKIYLLFCSFIIIFFTMFYLYDIPREVLYYSGLLCFTLAVIVSVIDFNNYKKSFNALHFLKDNLINDLDKLPISLDIRVQYYQKIIIRLFNELEKTIEENREKQTQLIDYYSMWVHQIKTPIAAIHFILDNGEHDNYMLEQELFKIECYVEMVLTYIRLGSENTDYVFEKVELSEIAREILKKYASLFINKKLTLNFVPQETFVITDKKWFSFALEQIISNAIKYTPRGSIVKIVLEENKITITDNGIGIKEEDLPRIFEQGFTGFNGRYEKKSSGIGLYLCKKILDNLEHTIKITSKTGIGTTVEIEFPQNYNYRE